MQREIRILEFDKIRSLLAEKCVTPMGRELAEDLEPTVEINLCRRWQAETTEAVSLLTRHQLGMDMVPDIRQLLVLAARGSVLGEEQLFGVLRLLNAITKVKLIFKEKVDYPVLSSIIGEMDPNPTLREELKRALDEEGRLRDNASPELSRLTRAIRSEERDLRDRFDRFIKNPGNQKLLQESLITMRGDRMVVPVRVEYRAQVQGVVHDQSASGASLFIEPLWAVEANNKVAVLRRDVQREKDRILACLSSIAGAAADALTLSLTLYVELDFIMAKGRQSLVYKGVEPQLNNDGYVKLVAARHPLLFGDVVPISLELGKNLRTLVITGPNTGGKTVTLKTVGLFAILAQSGLHVPAQEGTALTVFPCIFADIGDEQDISQSLSTFSGHLKNIIEILQTLVPGALVLLDEVGAGTDPTEGAGLAMAILEYLHQRGALTVATTHYSQLKTFAYLTEGMENASVEFDVATLRPTYQLFVGIPGVSNAFAIAKRLGLTDDVIDRARDFLTREETHLEEVVADLVADRKRLEYVSRQAEDESKQTHLILLQVKQEKDELERRRTAILEKARTEALEIVIRAKRESQQVLKELRKISALAVKPEAAQVETLETNMHLLVEDVRAFAPPVILNKQFTAVDIALGMEVQVSSLGQCGTVVQVSGEQVQVQVGQMRVHVALADLAPVTPTKKTKPEVMITSHFSRRDVASELDLRGLTFDEAAIEVDTYLAEAAVAALKEVRLIHGKGTGRLRAGLKDYLQGHPRVASMRMGQPNEGGTGVTVVELK